VKTSEIEKAEISAAVLRWMGNNQVCYATPGTTNHTANYYGDSTICKFTRPELAALIESAVEDWRDDENNRLSVQDVASEILADMQIARPE